MCTNAYVLQRFVHRCAVRRAALFRGRCGNAGAVETQAPYSGAGKGFIKLCRSLGAHRFSYAAWVVAGSAPKNACCEGTPMNSFCAASRLPLPPPCSRQRCLFVSLWAVDVGRRLQPLATRPKHLHHHAVPELMHPFCLVCGAGRKSTRAMRRGLGI